MLSKEQAHPAKDERLSFEMLTNKDLSQPTLKEILLAEDDASVRRFLEVVLRRAGYEVFAAEDGAIALQKAFETQFDLVILDAVMPNMTGSEVGRILRGHPNFQNIPIIILSGLDTEAGFDADARLLKTPDLQDELLTVVARLLAA